ncbi:MAG: nucleotidyltransferase family protein [Arenicella sp.]|nr:nucleotidyltransferase family protein [Arenicella sp.]
MKQSMTIAKSAERLKIDPSKTSVVLLAAGHGTRMRPLTDKLPKPLLKVGDHSLIEHHINRLSALGFKQIVINTAYLGEKIQQQLGNGERYGVDIHYSDESSTGALETAGGIKKSLPLIDSDPFLVVNADIYSDFDFSSLFKIEPDALGCLVLVPNPPHNLAGDFIINNPGMKHQGGSVSNSTMTFSGIALYRKIMFSVLPQGKLALGPILKRIIGNDKLVAMPYYGRWVDVGTPERLSELNSSLVSQIDSY